MVVTVVAVVVESVISNHSTVLSTLNLTNCGRVETRPNVTLGIEASIQSICSQLIKRQPRIAVIRSGNTK